MCAAELHGIIANKINTWLIWWQCSDIVLPVANKIELTSLVVSEILPENFSRMDAVLFYLNLKYNDTIKYQIGFYFHNETINTINNK